MPNWPSSHTLPMVSLCSALLCSASSPLPQFCKTNRTRFAPPRRWVSSLPTAPPRHTAPAGPAAPFQRVRRDSEGRGFAI